MIHFLLCTLPMMEPTTHDPKVLCSLVDLSVSWEGMLDKILKSWWMLCFLHDDFLWLPSIATVCNTVVDGKGFFWLHWDGLSSQKSKSMMPYVAAAVGGDGCWMNVAWMVLLCACLSCVSSLSWLLVGGRLCKAFFLAVGWCWCWGWNGLCKHRWLQASMLSGIVRHQ